MSFVHSPSRIFSRCFGTVPYENCASATWNNPKTASGFERRQAQTIETQCTLAICQAASQYLKTGEPIAIKANYFQQSLYLSRAILAVILYVRNNAERPIDTEALPIAVVRSVADVNLTTTRYIDMSLNCLAVPQDWEHI